MVDDEGQAWTSQRDISKCVVKYFEDLFKSTKPSWDMIGKALRYAEMRVDNAMNAYLEGDFSDEEIRKAMFEINASKALGPDGFSASFFHNLWDDIEDDICRDVK